MKPKGPTPFLAADALRRRDDEATAFAARHFAIRRAGFLLREHAKQQAEPSDPYEEEAVITSAEELPELAIESFGDSIGAALVERVPAGPTEEEITARITVAEQAAEQRGREAVMAEIAVALDSAIVALDAAAQALDAERARLERDCVVPLTRAGIELGSQLARQTLATSTGLERYLELVTDTLAQKAQTDAAVASSAPIFVRLNPEDVALLERANRRPALLQFQADPLVARGGVILGRGDQVIDDRLENRLREVRELALSAAAEALRDPS